MPSIRLISGTYGGRKIEAPSADNRRIHPMGERIRNAVFNSLGARLDGARVLDAFAGTGAVGLEALSRGAESAVFIEKDRIAQKILAANVETLGAASRAKLVKTSVSKWCETYDGPEFSLIFADPPYYDPQGSSVARLSETLADDGMMIVSWPEKEASLVIEGLDSIDERVYAGAKIIFYQKQKLSTATKKDF